jgi:hypothetical protein
MVPVRHWRFFTTMTVEDCAIAHNWGWEELNNGKVTVRACGFATLRAAVCDARQAGFSGEVDPENAGILFRRREDTMAERPAHFLDAMR